MSWWMSSRACDSLRASSLPQSGVLLLCPRPNNASGRGAEGLSPRRTRLFRMRTSTIWPLKHAKMELHQQNFFLPARSTSRTLGVTGPSLPTRSLHGVWLNESSLQTVSTRPTRKAYRCLRTGGAACFANASAVLTICARPAILYLLVFLVSTTSWCSCLLQAQVCPDALRHQGMVAPLLSLSCAYPECSLREGG